MARVIVADASGLIAYLDEHDVHHEAAITELIAVDQILVHPLTLTEVLVRPVALGVAGDVLARLEAIGMTVVSGDFDPLALAELRSSTRLKLPDCVVVLTARRHRAGVLTFDERVRAVADLRH
jgi:predicted nucleic acid-binding protein